MLREPPPLDDTTLRALLRLAVAAVDAALRDDPAPDLQCDLELAQRGGGAFVTLQHEGSLRGCIGSIAAPPPLWRTVLRMARSATREDDRFERLTEDDAAGIRVELSLLGEPFPIAYDQIEIGAHGLILDRGGVRALLLPQVATEHGMDRDAFLEALCRKAQLPPESWKDDDTRLWGFRTQSVAGPLHAQSEDRDG